MGRSVFVAQIQRISASMKLSSVTVLAALLLATAGVSRTVSAQVDLEGGWASLLHEVPGSLPINDAARLRTDSWW